MTHSEKGQPHLICQSQFVVSVQAGTHSSDHFQKICFEATMNLPAWKPLPWGLSASNISSWGGLEGGTGRGLYWQARLVNKWKILVKSKTLGGFFFAKLHVSIVCFLKEKRKMLEFQTKKSHFLIFNASFSTKSRCGNWCIWLHEDGLNEDSSWKE